MEPNRETERTIRSNLVSYRREVWEILKLAAPMAIVQLMFLMISFVSTVFCGHLGKTELAAVSLSTAIINVMGISVGTGLASTCDTLISQTFGSGNMKRVGVILQRGILILLLACCPCCAVLINTKHLLLAFRQDPEVARLSQLYVKIFIPALPLSFMYQLLARYLQNQVFPVLLQGFVCVGIIWPQVITGIIGNAFNALVNYVFIYVLHLDVAGSAMANALSQYCLTLSLLCYVCCRGLYKTTWGGWSWDCLQEWGSFTQLAVPGMLMMCLEWWTFEIGGFLAGLISEVELGAQSVVYQVASVCFMIPFGFGVATSVRVGNALGNADTEQAKASAKLAMACSGVATLCITAIVGGSSGVISYIFTSDTQIRERVSQVMVIYVPFQLADSTVATVSGIIRATGKQKVGAACNLLGYYVIGFPIGVSLMFAAKMGIVGLWIGLLISVYFQSAFFIIFLCRMNWNKVTEEAQIRAGVSSVRENRNERHNSDMHQETSLDDLGSGQIPSDRQVLQEVGEVLPFKKLLLQRGLVLFLMLLILALGFLTNILL